MGFIVHLAQHVVRGALLFRAPRERRELRGLFLDSGRLHASNEGRNYGANKSTATGALRPASTRTLAVALRNPRLVRDST